MVVCILAAGRGSRMQRLFPNIPKPLIPFKGVRVIDRQLSRLPTTARIVMSLGPNAAEVKRYLSENYSDRNIDFVVETDPRRMCKGPAISLLACRDLLRVPFWLLFSDTLWDEVLNPPTQDTLFVGEYGAEKPDRFCNVRFDDAGRVLSIHDKRPVIPSSYMKPFIGLAYIKNYDLFFNSLVPKQEERMDDLQLTHGWEALVKSGLFTQTMSSWMDVGTPENHQRASSGSFS